jgi:Mrp family chromosome partitioning ATPase
MSEQRESKADFTVKLNSGSRVKRLIGVVSGKGGVGKSLVTSLLAVRMSRGGHRVAIMDADLTGPSIPKIFGLQGKASGNKEGIFPVKSKTGIGVMSINLLLPGDSDPVIWRGPILAGTVKQFWSEVVWGEVDYMFVDLPPGTGDVPLTVFQSLPLDGIIIVTSPQELVSMIVKKAVKMAGMMKVPILGIVENMAYFKCPGCKEEHSIFGTSHLEEVAEDLGLAILARLPLDPGLAEACDRGEIEGYADFSLERAVAVLENLEGK